METEVKKPEVEAPPAEAKEAAPVAAPTQDDSQEQINWRRFREAREKERKEKIEAEKRAAEKDKEVAALKAAMDALVNKPSPPSYTADQPTDETEDQRIQRKVEESLRRERQKMEEERSQQEQATFPQKLAENYKDFDQICTEENLDYLEYHYPEVAFPYKHLPDSYSKWEKIYQAVKRFVPNVNSKKEQAKAEKNLTKPQSMSIHGKTQTGDSAPQMLDDKRKADNWARMQKTMRGG